MPYTSSSTTTTATSSNASNPASASEKRKPQTAQQMIRENLQSLIAQLEAGHSDALTAYLNAMSRFHQYSLLNCLEIARQRPTASRVAGMYAWNQLGRRVNKGEKGIRILAPILGIRRKPDEEAEKDIRVQNERVLVGFRHTYVWEQTSGADLPEPVKVYGDVGENYDRLLAFLERQGIELVLTENIAPALGASYGGRIAILPGQSQAETFTTLLHELGHELLMHASRRTTTTKTVRETEAEAVAFVVGKAIGLQTGSASADYIALYHGNASLLAESLEVIQQTAGVILAALETPFDTAAQQEANTEPAHETKRARRSRPQPAVREEQEAIAEAA